jgi:hypothetical protein
MAAYSSTRLISRAESPRIGLAQAIRPTTRPDFRTLGAMGIFVITRFFPVITNFNFLLEKPLKRVLSFAWAGLTTYHPLQRGTGACPARNGRDGGT